MAEGRSRSSGQGPAGNSGGADRTGCEALPGTAFAGRLERIKADSVSVAATRARIEVLMHDPGVAGRVREGLAQRRAAEAGTVGPGWLAGFLRDSDGGLGFRLRLGTAAAGPPGPGCAALAGASGALVAFCPE